MKNVKVEAVLRDMARRHGGTLSPEVVVAEARNKRHPLHSKFTWNDSEAAHQHRLWEARTLIRCCVEIEPTLHEEIPVFVSLSTDRVERNGYRLMTQVMSEPEMRAQLLRDALHDLNVLQKKYAVVKELARVWESVKKIRKAA